jgi:hypothetical protein
MILIMWTFNIIVDTRQAALYHPKHDWRLSVHVDGRLISCCAIVRYRTSVKKISSIASREDGKLVQGRLSFARLVSCIVGSILKS